MPVSLKYRIELRSKRNAPSMGMVYEARGQNKQAADCYRKVIEFVRRHPEQYDPDFERSP